MADPLPRLPARAYRGIARRAVGVASISVALSMLLSGFAFIALDLPHDVQNYAIAALIPALLATPLCFWLFVQLERVREAYRQLDRIASTDSLTQCLNRRAFRAAATRFSEGHAPGALLIADADHFKSINDRFGHDLGDQALSQIGGAIRASVRDSDIVGRIGGEEFGILLRDADLRTTQEIAERIRETVAAIDFRPAGIREGLSVSIGGACHASGVSFTDLFRAADQRLYGVKQSGRDGVDLAAATGRRLLPVAPAAAA